jgi:hypothetical protein
MSSTVSLAGSRSSFGSGIAPPSGFSVTTQADPGRVLRSPPVVSPHPQRLLAVDGVRALALAGPGTTATRCGRDSPPLPTVEAVHVAAVQGVVRVGDCCPNRPTPPARRTQFSPHTEHDPVRPAVRSCGLLGGRPPSTSSSTAATSRGLTSTVAVVHGLTLAMVYSSICS